jgi:aspartyl protease family protein
MRRCPSPISATEAAGRAVRALLCAAACLLAGSAMAQSVAMTGSMGSKALLVIDGGAPRALAAGESAQGVKVVKVTSSDALVEIAGKRQTVMLGAAPVSLGGAGGGANGSQILLTAGQGGHFYANGSINGRNVNFLVDTGATTIALGQAEAERIGLAYRHGRRIPVGTANGTTVGYLVKLDSVRINDVEIYNVDAIVQPAPMPYVLLGNSFLGRFQMKRENDLLTLDKRF